MSDSPPPDYFTESPISTGFPDLSIPIEHVSSGHSSESAKEFYDILTQPTKVRLKEPRDPEWDEFIGVPSKSKKKPPSEIQERFQQREAKAKEKFDRLLAEHKEKEKEICTFQPNGKAKKGVRSVEEFYKEQEQFRRLKEERLEALREEKERTDEGATSTYHPSISEKSQLLASQYNANSTYKQGSVFEKLYSTSKAPSASPSVQESSTFRPSVNPKSRDIVRDEPVESLLYKDALRRQQKTLPDEKPANIPLSSGSQKVLMEKLAREFDEMYEEFDPQNKGFLNYTNFNLFLEKMGFTKNDPDDPRYTEERNLTLKAWKLLVPQGTQLIHKQNLIVFLLCVMDLFPVSLASPNSSTSLGTLEDCEFVVSMQEAKKIHQVFNLFYSSRALVSKKAEVRAEDTPKASVLQTSEKLAQKHKQKRLETFGTDKTEEVGLAERKKYMEKLAKLRHDKEKSDLEECTFKPRINASYKSKQQTTTEGNRHLALYSLAQKRQEQMPEPVIRDGIEECTFMPKLKKSKTTQGKTQAIPGADKMIERMKKGREYQQIKNSMKLRAPAVDTQLKKSETEEDLTEETDFLDGTGSYKNSLMEKISEIKSMIAEKSEIKDENPEKITEKLSDNPIVNSLYEKAKTRIEQFEESFSDEDDLTVNIKLPNGGFAQLIIKETDDKAKKVQDFINKHQLSETAAAKLTQGILQSLE